jgi:hypothetical protein
MINQRPKGSEADSPVTANDYARPDSLLVELVQAVNELESSTGTTFTFIIGGSVITGMMISSAEYLTELGRSLAAGMPDDVKTKVIERYTLRAQQAKRPRGNRAPPRFMHLRDARVFAPLGTVPSGPGLLLRVRLSDVSGFSPVGMKVSAPALGSGKWHGGGSV